MSEVKVFNVIGEICRDWWAELAAIDPSTGEERIGGAPPDRRQLADLRRISSETWEHGEHIDVAVAAGIGAYCTLSNRLRGCLLARQLDWTRRIVEQEAFAEAVAVVASTLARVRRDTDPKTAVARRLGLDKNGKTVSGDEGRRVMAEARFKRLIRTRDWPDLLDQGRRIVQLLDRDVSVADLGSSLLLWNAGPHVVRHWSFAYYGVEWQPPEPSDNPAFAQPIVS
jgi:CRISPR type I-E-associated protein CasB/Cse2